MKTDTIAAIATAMSNSGIGIVRISGDEALEVADRIFRPKKGSRKVSDMETHTIHYGYVVDGEEVVDEVMLLIMKAPRSYTCEDTIEIDCHGGVLVMKKILETVLKYGARPAEPGEFTKRAFLNGRIDLSQAESVIDVINAQNELALKSSVSQLQGAVLEKIKDIRAVVLHEIAFIESALDDPEHVSLDGYPEQLRGIMSDAHSKVKKLLDSSDNGKMLKEGINTAIVGKPNAGKSSLLNILVGEERAIVTEIAGTTRDILQEQIQIGGIGLNVIDTAGIRDTEDIVEKIGVNKSREYIEKADLIIYVVDSSTELDENDQEIIEAIQDKKAIVLLNKSDLDAKTDAAILQERLDKPILSISAKNNTGIHELEKLIEEMFFSGKLSFNDEVYITNIRQKNALAEAESSLKMVLQSIDDGMPEDFFTIDMMNAYEVLGTIIGESVGEDLVNEIFSKFCMGK
ncbi:tRNA modification GTPase [Eubacterium ramulus]|jgi:tRNA modification GTPase|uniref:tRNA modification GTPase MnmE n=1 Tax=Eubacterium ramulus TaxID=39490 RepID=A0A2V1JP39_EUBRA|nr:MULTISPECIES: tRNA uridine-5-carboxymethylaminomethyl(34) synthesis GTPase MnmE [Clostridia]MBS5190927.1 tRNA uridine-5-carboxymethylaminomethyl(34) synthesis GTPase MnmE [Lachnospiraceae bacterium]PWE86640.1 tRNA modification GTPase [Eubacterium ramulus]RHV72114.1 tRNA uridine-5-carboxymethylaminomethyl(34) synthesis GTPase MnmE [Roseburia sp. OM02-15]